MADGTALELPCDNVLVMTKVEMLRSQSDSSLGISVVVALGCVCFRIGCHTTA